MPRISSVARDPAIEDNGQEKEIPTLRGAYVTVRSTNYKKFEQAVTRRLMSLPRHQREVSIGAVRRECAADHLIVGWRELEDEEGVPMQCTPEKRRMLMTDRRYVDIANGIMAVCEEVGTSEQEEIEGEVGN